VRCAIAKHAQVDERSEDPAGELYPHGRRQFVEIAASFPQGYGYGLEALGMVYGNDALTREQGLDAEVRLRFHQRYSGPLMEKLHGWLQEHWTRRRPSPTQG